MKVRYFLFVLLAALVPPLLAVYVTADVSLNAEAVLENRLSSASAAVQTRLDAETARRRELLLRLVQLPGVTEGLRAAAVEKRAPGPETVAALRAAVLELFPLEAPELFSVATAHGAQVVITSGEPKAFESGQVPLAAQAFSGQLVDSFARFEGSLFRVFAAPVGVGEAAIVVGDRVGTPTANRLRDFSKSDHVSFVETPDLVDVSTLPVGTRDPVVEASRQAGRTLRTGRLGTGFAATAPLNEWFPLLAPAAKERHLATALSGGVTLVVTQSAERTLGWLGRLQLLSILASLACLLVGLVWSQLVYGPVWRQARSIEAHLARLHVERTARIGLKGFAKPFVGVATELDKLVAFLEKATVDAPRETTPPAAESTPKPPKPLDLPLQTAPTSTEPEEAEVSAGAFPFGETLRATGTDAVSPSPSEPADEPRRVPELPVAAQIVEKPLDPAVRLPSPPPPTDPVPLPAPSQLGERKPQGTTPPPAAKDPFSAFGPPPEPAADNDRTREALIPEELLARSRELENELLEPPLDPDEEHFREVYEQFVDMRRKAGEGVQGLTLDKFAARLKKNREQLVARYNCRTVRFSVYLKEGKAAIKASPVK